MPTPYPIDANDSLILNFDGTNGDTTTTDESPSARVGTFVGSAKIDTSEFFHNDHTLGASPGSLYVPSTGSYLQYPDSTAWDVFMGTTNDFMIDFYVKFNSLGNQGFFGQYQSSTFYWGMYYDSGSNKIILTSTRTATQQNHHISFTPAIDTWYHIAVGRDASKRYMFIDGVEQTLLIDTNNGQLSTFSAPFNIGYFQRQSYYLDGYIEGFRFSQVVRWTSDFTPPNFPYGFFVVPVDSDLEVYQQKAMYPKDRWTRKRPNTGWFDVAGLHVPVPLKMDKWDPKNAVPARQKKKGRGKTQEVHVDFNVPILPEVTLDKWFFQHPVPRKRFEKKIIRPHEILVDFVEAWQIKNGNYQDTGVFGFQITKISDDAATFNDVTPFDFTITAEHVEDFQLEDTGTFNFTIKYPDTGNEVFNSGVPGFVSANVIINGVNESNKISGSINVTREDNTAARFKCTINLDQTLVPPRKPSELINKIVQISFAAADMTGVVADYVPIFVGICKHVTFSDDQQAINMTGYDYGGVHQTKGEFVSDNVTTVFTGSLYVNSAGTHSLGHSPVWGVVWTGNPEVKDGEDYFVNTLNGSIIVPISSRILQFPGAFIYNYQSPFGSMKEIIQSVASLKGWTLQEDNVTIADYSSTAEHPVLSLSDESVIDVCRKFLELSGAKVESNLYPNLRVYSEVQNVINTVNIHTVDESKIFENTLIFRVDFDGILNEQTTRSVQKINANVVVGATETIAEFSGEKPPVNPFVFQTNVSSVWSLDLGLEAVLAEHRVNKQGLNSISFESSGRFFMNFNFDSFEETITGASWNSFVDGDDFVIQLKHKLEVVGILGVRMWAYPAIEYTLTVKGSKINYGDGTIEDIKIVTAQRPIIGITETLKGDVYENPYIETEQHCANICDAILLEHGNPYSVRFELPVFEGKDMNIGDRINIKKDSNTRFTGLIKTLSYSINLQNGENSIFVTAKGVGFGV